MSCSLQNTVNLIQHPRDDPPYHAACRQTLDRDGDDCGVALSKSVQMTFYGWQGKL